MFKLKGDTNKLIRGISFSWLRFILTIGIGLVQTPILFKNLTSNELNFWYVFFSFGAFLQMADLGLVQTISRLIAYIDNSSEVSEKDIIGILSKYKTKQIYVTTLFSFTCILILISFIVYVSFLYSHEALSYELKASFFLYIIGIMFALLSNVPGAMLVGYRDVGPESIVRSIFQILYFLLLLGGLPFYKSILFVSFIFLIQNVGQFVVLHFTFFVRHNKIFKEFVPSKKLIQFNISYSVYKQSMPLVINQMGGWLISQGNIFVAYLVVGSTQISDYAINQQVFTYIASISLVINQTMGPFIAKYYIQNKHEALKELYSSTTIICLSIVSLLLIIQLVCGYEIIDMWVGSEHYLGVTFSVVFALITFLEVNHSVGGNFVWNTSSWPFNGWTLAAGIFNVLLGYLLGKYYGLIGMAFATFVSKLVTLNWFVIYYCLKQLGMFVKDYLFKTFVPLVGTLLILLVVNFYLKVFLQTLNLNIFLIVVMVSISSFMTLVLLTSIIFKSHFLNLYQTVIVKTKNVSTNAFDNYSK
ncbi:lipopolysaccharide biosynthesis protein [Spirosoma agri]|uniref:Oligosaccharide flippase family protein n=1 Tax=Spirosoma agri TaxID=1987381 RepID=A0A6M0IKP0_9BACT|nr:hypothetical protein [Spirosoma agri]NEU68849.1 hypothetical protein [Spirosoma agri]